MRYSRNLFQSFETWCGCSLFWLSIVPYFYVSKVKLVNRYWYWSATLMRCQACLSFCWAASWGKSRCRARPWALTSQIHSHPVFDQSSQDRDQSRKFRFSKFPGSGLNKNLVNSVFCCCSWRTSSKMLPKPRFSKPIFGHPAGSTKLYLPNCKQFLFESSKLQSGREQLWGRDRRVLEEPNLIGPPPPDAWKPALGHCGTHLRDLPSVTQKHTAQ